MKQTFVSVAAAGALVALACGGTPAPPPITFLETLDATSAYIRGDCLGPCLCAMPPMSGPATGSFWLVFSHADEWTSYYDVVNIVITASTEMEAPFTYSGTGRYEYGGDFALTHRLVLDLVPSNNPSAVHHFDSSYKLVEHGPYVFPAITILVDGELMGCTKRWLQINTTAQSSCEADIGRQGGQAGSDGLLNNNDFIVFIELFFAGDARADRGVQGGTAGADGLFDNNDFIVFINQFFTPC